MHIINLFDPTGFKDANYGPKYTGAEKDLGSVFGSINLGFHLEIMNPKTFSCPYHYHTQEEELVLVVEGEAVARCGGEFRKVKAGDLIYYGVGPSSVHHMYNHTDKAFKFFVLSTRFPEEFCHYPDSKKMLDRKQRLITQNGVKAEYFKDEEDPSIYWPEHALRGDVP